MSPSAVESYEECGLNWVVSALGGDTVMPPTAGIGTIVHEAMERVPDGDLARMREIVEEHWPELDFETAWIGRKERRRADLFVDRLHSYLGEVTRDGGRVLGSEVEFRFAVDVSGETAEPSVYPVGRTAVTAPSCTATSTGSRRIRPARANTDRRAAAAGSRWPVGRRGPRWSSTSRPGRPIRRRTAASSTMPSSRPIRSLCRRGSCPVPRPVRSGARVW